MDAQANPDNTSPSVPATPPRQPSDKDDIDRNAFDSLASSEANASGQQLQGQEWPCCVDASPGRETY